MVPHVHIILLLNWPSGRYSTRNVTPRCLQNQIKILAITVKFLRLVLRLVFLLGWTCFVPYVQRFVWEVLLYARPFLKLHWFEVLNTVHTTCAMAIRRAFFKSIYLESVTIFRLNCMHFLKRKPKLIFSQEDWHFRHLSTVLSNI